MTARRFRPQLGSVLTALALAASAALGATACRTGSPSARLLQGAENPLGGTLPSPSPSPSLSPLPLPSPSPSGPAVGDADAAWRARWWLQKAVRALRGGAGLDRGDDVTQLLALPREQVVRKLLDDPRFADSVLDFDMMFLGFRRDRIRRESGNYEDAVYEMPEAISAASAVLSGGDYFKLFDLQHPIYLGPLRPPESLDAGDDLLPAPVVRQKIYHAIQADLDRIIALATGDAAANPPVLPATPAQVCEAFSEHEEKFVYSNILNLPQTIPRSILIERGDWYGLLEFQCPDLPAGYDFAHDLQRIKDLNQRLFDKLAAFEPAGYRTTTVAAVKALDLSDLGIPYRHSPFTFTIQRALQNSSTNFDRKRAAYVLKRFFCDDLTPVNVEMPATHAAGRHATDPSCFACHYKLDPMAGFFRDLGRQFRDYGQRQQIYFDDGAHLDRRQYESAWQPGPDAARPWNVGYIRSTRDLTANTYGSTMDDLYAMLKTAPEVKRCMIKRLWEYLVSDRQIVDGDFLGYLTEQFAQESAAQGSSAALKNAFSRIVLSQAFSTPDADTNSCYDHRPGAPAAGAGGAPCRIASVLNRRCVQCHHSTEQDPYLDLSQWKTLPDGSVGFPHFDDSGRPVPAAATFQQMIDRITSTDDDERMPYRSDMPSTERQELFVWLSSQAAPGGGASR